MRTHPSSGGFFLAIRQEIDCLVALHIYQDRAEIPSTTEREILYSKLRYAFYGCCWKDHDTAKDRGWRRLNSETLRKSGSQLSTGSSKAGSRSVKIFLMQSVWSQKNRRTCRMSCTRKPAQGKSATTRA